MSNNKEKGLDELELIKKDAKSRGLKIILAHGVFDLLHYGHMMYLEQSKNLGDLLVVSVVADRFVKKGPGKPFYNQNIRLYSIAALEYVDYVVLCDDFGPWEILETLQPQIYSRAKDVAYLLNDPDSGLNKDKRIAEEVGGKLIFVDEVPEFHSSGILNEYFPVYPPEMSSFLRSYKQRHTANEIIEKIEQLRNLRVLVVGEAIIDRYCYTIPLGRANKANILSTQTISEEDFAGGSLACANHVAGICENVDLVTYIGEELAMKDFIAGKLKSNITPHLFVCSDRPTVLKTRFIDQSYFAKLFEYCNFNQAYLPQRIEKEIIEFLEKNLCNYDVVIVVDYGHGLLTPGIIDVISKLSKFIAANVQTNSGNFGFNYITRYPRVDYACLDEIELRLALQDRFGDVEEIAGRLMENSSSIKNLIVTLGYRGSMAYIKGNNFFIPPLTIKVTDTMGAGDAYLSVSSLCSAGGFPLELTAFVGNVAGAIATGILGNKSPVEKTDLFRYIESFLK